MSSKRYNVMLKTPKTGVIKMNDKPMPLYDACVFKSKLINPNQCYLLETPIKGKQ